VHRNASARAIGMSMEDFMFLAWPDSRGSCSESSPRMAGVRCCVLAAWVSRCVPVCNCDYTGFLSMKRSKSPIIATVCTKHSAPGRAPWSFQGAFSGPKLNPHSMLALDRFAWIRPLWECEINDLIMNCSTTEERHPSTCTISHGVSSKITVHITLENTWAQSMFVCSCLNNTFPLVETGNEVLSQLITDIPFLLIGPPLLAVCLLARQAEMVVDHPPSCWRQLQPTAGTLGASGSSLGGAGAASFHRGGPGLLDRLGNDCRLR
jgi:hypothetical protein